MNRDERRRADREEMELYRAHGLPPRLSFPAMFAHTAALRRLLERREDPLRARHVVEAFHAGFERSMAHVPPEPRVACAAGCSMCCHNWIPVTAPEALLIAAHLRGADLAAARAAEMAHAAEAGRGLDRDQRLEQRLACPLLAEGLCSIYALRPLACRSFFSLSLDACRGIFEGRTEDLPAWRPAMVLRGFHDRCLQAALKATGHELTSYELTDAVATALSEPEVEKRWLDGEDVFAAVEREEEAGDDEILFLDVLVAGAAGRRLPPNPWTT